MLLFATGVSFHLSTEIFAGFSRKSLIGSLVFLHLLPLKEQLSDLAAAAASESATQLAKNTVAG